VPGEQLGIPSGTVTFLFSDVVGSTRQWAADPEAMSGSLRIHDRIFNDTIARHNGHVFATAGDSFAVAFARASEAVECAEAIQAALAHVDWGSCPALSVRIGLHLGEAEERDANYFGPTVNQAARVMAVAHGGQTILTDGVRDAAGVVVTDLGTHLLRDIEAPVHLSQLGDHGFPPLWSAGNGIVSLPSPRTSLIGRDEAVEHIRELVGAHRLVTLAGVGGCGKTRLAIETAYREIPSHPQGVWFVDLSTIADAAALPGAFASALRLSVEAGTEPLDQFVAYVAPRVALLVVDNCEHVIEEVADVVDRLLEECPDLRIVTTSREALEVDGEFTWKVPSLATGRNDPGVRLFVDRAEAAGAELTDDARTTEAVRNIVERLDGIPLAIELAAAHTRSMSVTEVLHLLDDRFSLLSGGSRRSRQRQATLEGAVQWSYDLLSEEEQDLLMTLSVFQGGFAVSDVAVVARTSEVNARSLIGALTAKSLVDVTRDASGEVRHRLLETIRLFALARLVESGAAVDTRDRHLEHFAMDALDRRIEPVYRWSLLDHVIRSGREYENFRSAITWALERGQIGTAVQMAAMGMDASAARGEAQLAIDVLRRDVDLEPKAEGFVQAVLSFALATQGDPTGAMACAERALAIARDHGGAFDWFALQVQGTVAYVSGAIAENVALYTEASRRMYATAPDFAVATQPFMMAGHCSLLQFDAAVARGDEALAHDFGYGYVHFIEAYRAWALLASGQIDRAVRAVELFSDVPAGSQFGHVNIVVAHTVMGHTNSPREAARSLTTSIAEMAARRPSIRSDVLQGFAYLAHLGGELDRSREIVANTQPFGTAPIFDWLRLVPDGATAADALTHWERLYAADPATDRLARVALHSKRLLEEELERWK
jgi:predicted ATPase/class 3 adenylate cyclase